MNNSQEQYLIDCWQSLINYIRDHGQVDVSLIESFYEPAYIHSFTNDKVIIITENTVAKQIMSSQSDVIKNAFIDLFDTGLNFTVTIYQVSELKIAPELTGKKVSEKHVAQFPSMPLQSDKTFENFIVGDCNRESKAAALACAVGPGQFYNPLFIFGNSGLGKTHLLMAIANYVLANDPGKKVYYTESLKFVETVVSCIQNNTIDDFKQYMYNVDVLIVDDIQFLAGKEKSHEVFFTIYNELVSHKKQICLASDRQPREIKGLEERLITRFSSGLSVGIDSPEFETSLAILRTKIKSNGSGSGMGIGDIEDEGLNYIASNFSGNVRDLEGAWNRVLFYAIQFQPDGGVIRFQTVLNALKGQAVVSEKGLSPNVIMKEVADYYGITKQQITSKTRTKTVSMARQISIYLCRELLELSYIRIGEEFGGRDHSTIMSACTKVKKSIKKDASFKAAVDEITTKLGQRS